MLLVIKADDPRPIYQQVADGIRDLIARGELSEGTSLPPVRQLAADLGVNLNTIATAYRELQKDGLLSVRHGSGSVVTARQAAPPRKQAELVTPLRTALTRFVLAGWSTEQILALVQKELALTGKDTR